MRKFNLFVVCLLIVGCSYIQKAPLEFTGKVGGQIPIAKDLAQNTEKLTMAVWVKPEEKIDADLIAIGNHNKDSVTASRACLKINWDGRVTVYGRSTFPFCLVVLEIPFSPLLPALIPCNVKPLRFAVFPVFFPTLLAIWV